MTTRRDFIQTSGMGLMAAATPSLFNNVSVVQRKLSVQLYTIREEIKKDVRGSLKRLAEIGFKNVETAFWPEDIKLSQAADYIKEFGFSVSSCHIEIPIGDQKQIMLDTAKAYNCKNMIWHGWPEDARYSSLEGTKALIKIYNESAKIAKDNGLVFGLHNHWWEYKNKVGGKLVYEILNEELDPNIFFETDIYWVKVAGHDPATVIKKLGKRVKFLHIKDGPAEWNDKLAIDNPDPMTPVGQGTQNIPAVLNACGLSVQCLVIEMDKTDINVFDALKQSYDYMTQFRGVSKR
jgi:sugar phosphate isomerase/epimerase